MYLEEEEYEDIDSLDQSKINPPYKYPLSNKNKNNTKFRVSCHLKFFKNPVITRFNLQSNFIYDLDEAQTYLDIIKDKNLIKPNSEHINFLTDLVNKIYIERDIEKKRQFVNIPKEIYQKLIDFSNSKPLEDPLVKFIKDKFDSEQNKANLTCRKLCSAYLEEKGLHTNRQTICNIIKNQLGYRYRKSKIKNNRINDMENIFVSCSFIKIISRCIKLGFKIIYCDETGYSNSNNNFYSWVKKEEDAFCYFKEIKKSNLIMAVDKEQVLHYNISIQSTTSSVFLNFIQELHQKLLKMNYGKYIIVLDNLSSHKTQEVIEYYYKNRINVIFNSPYMSKFNAIELSFRFLKKNIYNSLFSSINSLDSRIVELITSNEFKKSLKNSYAMTLNEYINFYNSIKEKNFNNV